jgi:hypothetical protein
MPDPLPSIRTIMRAVLLACACFCLPAGSAGAVTLRGDGARDVLRGTPGKDRLVGREGNDRLSGLRGNDTLLGGRGRDRLSGGRGRDLLIGGPGRDRVLCGPGRDRAVLGSGDRILDARRSNPDGSCERVRRPTVVHADAFLAAAGDIADCKPGAAITAGLLDALPGTVALLGDAAYEDGSPADFANCYDPTWGRHKARTRPAIGNHEYGYPGAAGYWDYFGAAAGPRGKGWYSYEAGAWHVVALNSNCSQVGGCHPGSEQERWLRADLEAHPAKCTLAYMHQPRFSSGNAHGGSPGMEPLWRALQDHGAEVVLAGHDHDYERFAPQTAGGALDAKRGIRQFVVGTGGRPLRSFGPPKPFSEVRNNSTWGVLHLRLRARSYDWRFVAQPGNAFTDSGSTTCH